MIAVRVSAYAGVRMREGREIVKGDLIGVDPDTRNFVPSPASGVVKGISFDPESHTLIVDIEAAEIVATLQGRGHRAKR